MRKAIDRLINTYFDKALSLQTQFFHLLMFVGVVTAIVVALIALFIDGGVVAVGIDAAIAVIATLLLFYARSTRRYNLCSWIAIVLVFMIAFPVMFIMCGGHSSGMSCFFVLALVFTSHMLQKRERIIAIALEFIVYIGCCIYIFIVPMPDYNPQSEHIYIINASVNFAASGVLLLLTVLLRNRMIAIRQRQIQELNYELELRNETLTQYDRMKSDFIEAIAHEINTPLAVIAASSHDTLDLLKTPSPNMEEIIENQNTIVKRVKLIDNIIMDLSDTVAIENGRLSLSRHPVNLSELLRNLCDTEFKRLDANNNRIALELQDGLPRIIADQQRIEQVVTNLLSNAVRHTKHGVITVRLSRAEKTQTVSVIDTGEGMSAETLRLALVQRVSTKADYWRHGIGLHICRQIISAHGGVIWIESEEGVGTGVFFSLTEEAEHE